MKKMKIFYVNDGLDGVVVAKNISQVAKILAPFYGYSQKVIKESLKKSERNFGAEDWTITKIINVPKKGQYRKPKVLGWCE